MSRSLIVIAVALLIAALTAYYQFVVVVVEAFGPASAIVIVALCYVVACQIHRRERGY